MLLFAAVGLLIAALGTGHTGLAWGSVALSVVAAAVILRRWRRSWLQRQDAPEDESAPRQEEELADAEEETDAADLLIVYELVDEVLVIDEHPRYHLARCRFSDQVRGERLPVREARELGFTPCGLCRPDTTLARKYRAARTTSAGSS
ncbi:MAG: hypothetical protein ACRDQY_01625 [Pseudonocardiaceae bacterium]